MAGMVCIPAYLRKEGRNPTGTELCNASAYARIVLMRGLPCSISYRPFRVEFVQQINDALQNLRNEDEHVVVVTAEQRDQSQDPKLPAPEIRDSIKLVDPERHQCRQNLFGGALWRQIHSCWCEPKGSKLSTQCAR